MAEYTPEEQLEMIEISSEQAKEKVELRDAVAALLKNKHFKKVFSDYYLKKYPVRLISLKASVSMQDEQHQKFIGNQLNAIGHLDQFLSYVEQEGNASERLINQNQEEMDLIRAEAGVA